MHKNVNYYIWYELYFKKIKIAHIFIRKVLKKVSVRVYMVPLRVRSVMRTFLWITFSFIDVNTICFQIHTLFTSMYIKKIEIECFMHHNIILRQKYRKNCDKNIFLPQNVDIVRKLLLVKINFLDNLYRFLYLNSKNQLAVDKLLYNCIFERHVSTITDMI